MPDAPFDQVPPEEWADISLELIRRLLRKGFSIHDAKDLTQEAIADALESDRWDGKRSLRTYLRAIVHNLAHNHRYRLFATSRTDATAPATFDQLQRSPITPEGALGL